ncbi:YadA family autotransporter adhesin, partial [Pseudomonas sp. BGr12]|uniref:YadA family autotransporter adhesin n=1 Tax=Pseudomonas sp. BGr12 TaxID=2936269 RepID=UPI0025598524
DAINGSQLFATNQAIDGINTNIDVLDKGTVKYDTNTDGTVNYNSITLGGDTYNSTTKKGGTTINNVAWATDDSSAVNLQQLNETVSSATTNIYNTGVKYFHTNSVKDDSHAEGADSIAVGPKAVSSGTSSIAMGDGASTGANAANSVAMGSGASTTQEGNVALGAGTSDDGRGKDSYVGKYSGAQNDTAGVVSVGNAATGETRTITNVADGKQDTDAVNLRQLDGAIAGANSYTDNSVKEVNANIANVTNDVTNIKNGTDGMFQVNNTSNLPKPKPTGKDSTAGGAGSVASGDNSTAIGSNAQATASNSVALGSNSVADRANTVSVGSVGNERQITHVADGTADTDAVNLRQLTKATGDINNSINNVYSDLKHDLNKQDDTLSAGIAGALAAATLPQPYQPGASMASVGAGNYRGQQALAVGVSRISDNGKWVTKLSANTDTQGEFGVSVGVGYQW